MKYATASAFKAALEARLRDRSTEQHLPLPRLRKILVFERLLARLFIIAPDRWVVKGGVALDFRMGDRARSTKDLDLVRQGSVAAANADMLALQTIDLGDYFTFTIEPIPARKATGETVSARFRALAELDDRRFEMVTIDVGFDYSFVNSPDHLESHNFLEFAGVPPLQIPALPLERHLAEKLHAYTRTYVGGLASSRVKDLVDIVLIGSIAAFRAGRLRREIEATFAERATHDIPASLPPPPATWHDQFHLLATEVDLNPNLDVGYKHAAELFDPVLRDSTDEEAVWDATAWEWRVTT